ncbi:MAG: hypothetical protein E5Y79_11445 [Mesorhizobium sp.]|nr:MAG: hypothetical protein E5Y79_11445 [Mesorhizobium sp.]
MHVPTTLQLQWFSCEQSCRCRCAVTRRPSRRLSATAAASAIGNAMAGANDLMFSPPSLHTPVGYPGTHA